MRRETRQADPELGYAWLESEGEYYLRNPEGDLRRVSNDAFRLLSELAEGGMVYEELPENAREIVDVLRDEGYVRNGDPVVELVPPEDVALWPRVAGFLALLGVGAVAAVQAFPRVYPVDGLFTPARVVGFVALMLVSLVVHESGHYLAANRYLDPTVRLGTVNGVIPSAITDTTDAWMLPRNRRLWITLAGPFAQLVWTNALVAVHYLLFPESVLLSLVVVMNVVNVVLVFNPLIHGDGYWLVLDTFGIVDLRTRGIEDLREREFSAAAAYVLLSYGFAVAVVTIGLVNVAAFFGVHVPVPDLVAVAVPV
jgi:hypothetical protein